MPGTQVLIVEDDAALARTIAINLQARGVSAMQANTVAEAMGCLASPLPEVLLLDIDLPDGCGWDVARALRAADSAAAVIVMSGLRPNQRLIREIGCVGVLEKPFPIASLLRLVAEVLPAFQSTPEAVS